MRVLQHVVRDMGLQVEICPQPTECIDQIKRLIPAVILVDATAPGMDIDRLIRIVSHYPATAATAVVLIAPLEASERKRRLLASYESFAVLDRPLTCHSVRETVRAAVKTCLELRSAQKPVRRSVARLVPGCNSLLARTLLCPFHPYPVEVTAYALRAGKVYVEHDAFDVPIYRQATPGNDFVDFHRVELIICAQCLFTGTDPAAFEDPGNLVGPQGAGRSAQEDATRAVVADDTPRRERILLERIPGDANALVRFDRSLDQTMALYDLAVASSQTLYESAPERHGSELLRIANYQLRRAAILSAARPEEIAPPEAAQQAFRYRQAAIPWLRRAFACSRGSAAACQAGYQLVALHIWLNDDASASGHVTALSDLTKLSRRSIADPVLLERYLRRAQALWAKRDRHRAVKAAA